MCVVAAGSSVVLRYVASSPAPSPPPRAGDYEREGTPAAAASVEGYIAPPGGAPVRPFRLDAALPPVKLADALWAAVGEAHGLSS